MASESPSGRFSPVRTRNAVAAAALLTLLLAVPSLGLVGHLPSASAPRPAPRIATPAVIPNLPKGMSTFPPPPSLATFQLLSTTPTTTISGQFWGADVRIFSPANSTLAAGYNASGLEFVRWPGGAVADEYNLSSNRLYHALGRYITPPTSFLQFVHWCLPVRCQAIVQLPGEIGSPSTAAYLVNYIENVVGFHPAYYEIGNEPALWKHYGIPWSNWTSTQRVKVTAMGYAHLVQNYTAAIRGVDPDAQIIGLPGFGQGGYHEPTWIQDSVAVNGPNLSAVSIHVYPSGRGPAGTPSLVHFYNSLSGRGALPFRVPRDRAAIAAGCGSCSNLQLIVSEMGAGNAGGSYTPFMKGYDDVPYIGTEILQGLALNVTNIDLFALQSRFPGSIMDTGYQMTPVGQLYESFFTQLGRGILPVSHGTLTPGVQILAAQGAQAGTVVLFVLSANATNAQVVNLQGSGFPDGPGSVITWNASVAAPQTTNYSRNVPTYYLVPPQGLLMIVVQSSQIGPTPPTPGAHPVLAELPPAHPQRAADPSVFWHIAARSARAA